jgi:hypothetical protein
MMKRAMTHKEFNEWLKFVDLNIGDWVVLERNRQLQQVRAFDHSLLFIEGDHYSPRDVMIPPLDVKRPGQDWPAGAKFMSVDGSPARVIMPSEPEEELGNNLLSGMCCPNCEQTDEFEIAVSVWARVTDDGSETHGDHEWDETSACRCPECGWIGSVGDCRSETDDISMKPGNMRRRTGMANQSATESGDDGGPRP